MNFFAVRKIPQLGFWQRFRYLRDIRRIKRLKPDHGKYVELFGFRIYYDSFESLRNLLKEIFVDFTYYCKLKTDTPVILDVGSNIGIAMLFFKKLYPGSKIFCFEPDPEIYAILQKNVSQNGLQDVYLYNVALSDKEGSTKLFVPDWSSGSSSILSQKVEIEKKLISDKGISNINTRSVRMIQGSHFINSKDIQHIDLLKIDVEGAEERVLRDLACVLDRIDIVLIEFHYSRELIDINSMAGIISVFEAANFIVRIVPLWVTSEPEVMGTYLIKAINGSSSYINNDPF